MELRKEALEAHNGAVIAEVHELQKERLNILNAARIKTETTAKSLKRDLATKDGMKYSKLYDVEMWKNRAAELTVLLRDTIACTKARQQELERYRKEVTRLQAENAMLKSQQAENQSNGDATRQLADLQKSALNGVHPASTSSDSNGVAVAVAVHKESKDTVVDREEIKQLKQEITELKSRLEESKKHLGSERRLSDRWKAEAAVLRSRSSEDGLSSPGDSAQDDERLGALKTELRAVKSELSVAKRELERQAVLQVDSEKSLRQEHENKKLLLLQEVKSVYSQCESQRKIVHKLKAALKAQTHALSTSPAPPPLQVVTPPTLGSPPQNDPVSLEQMKSFHAELLGLREMTSQVVGRMRELAAVK